MGENDYVSLDGTLDRFETNGLQLIEMVLSDQYGWDGYEAPQWIAVDDFLSANPDYSDARSLYEWTGINRRRYLKYGRHYLNWGIFVLRISNK